MRYSTPYQLSDLCWRQLPNILSIWRFWNNWDITQIWNALLYLGNDWAEVGPHGYVGCMTMSHKTPYQFSDLSWRQLWNILSIWRLSVNIGALRRFKKQQNLNHSLSVANPWKGRGLYRPRCHFRSTDGTIGYMRNSLPCIRRTVMWGTVYRTMDWLWLAVSLLSHVLM